MNADRGSQPQPNGFGPDPGGGQRAGFSTTAQTNRGDFGI